MKVVLIVLAASLSGCMTYPQNNATPEQRALAMQYFLGNQAPRPYVVPNIPQPNYAPQPKTYNCTPNYGSQVGTNYTCQSQ